MHTKRTPSTMIFQHFLFRFTLTIPTIVKGKTELVEQLFSAYTHVISHMRPPHYINTGGTMLLVVSLNTLSVV